MGNHLAQTTGWISLATMLSRVLGLVRQQLFAALLGATNLADAFTVAFRIPNLLRDLFAEGALSQAFIPIFKKEKTLHGDSRAFELGNRVAGNLLAIIGLLVLVATLFAEDICKVLGQNFSTNPGQLEVATLLTRIMLPFLPIVSLAAVAMGMLNANRRFAAPALAPAMFNVASIGFGIGLYLAGVDDRWVVIGWSIGTVIGGMCQLGIQLPFLWRIGYRPRLALDLRLRDPGVASIAKLMVPAVAGLAAVQVNIVVNTWFATSENGAAVCLDYAFRFLQLPIGVFAVAIATVSTTRYADAAAASDAPQAARHVTEGLRLVAFLTVPSTIGLVVLSEPIIDLVYFRGKFGGKALLWTTDALRLYATGLVAYSAVKVLAPAFYAFDRARIPMFASLSAVVANLILNVSLHPHYGFRVLAVGTALAATVNVIVLYAAFSRRIAHPKHAELLLHVGKVLLASAAMALVVWLLSQWLSNVAPGRSIALRGLRTFAPIIAGVVVYGTACSALRVPEIKPYLAKLLRTSRRAR